MDTQKSNEYFFKSIKQSYGVEAYEEFLDGVAFTTFKACDDHNISLYMLSDIMKTLNKKIKTLKRLPIKDRNSVKALSRGIAFEYILKMHNKKLYEEVSFIISILEDAYIEAVLT